jgi:hypothetical protein
VSTADYDKQGNKSAASTETTTINYYNVADLKYKGEVQNITTTKTEIDFYGTKPYKRHSQSTYKSTTAYSWNWIDSRNPVEVTTESSSETVTFYKTNGTTKTSQITYKDGIIVSEKFFSTSASPKNKKAKAKVKKSKATVKTSKWAKTLLIGKVTTSSKKVKATYSVGKVKLSGKGVKKGKKVKVNITIGDKNFPASATKYVYTVTLR